jgi:hypothetical protein
MGLLRRLIFFAVLVVAGAANAGASDTLTTRLGVRLYGLPVGQMVLAANAGANAYAARGEFRTTGLVGFLAKVRFTMSARGVGHLPGLTSRSYSEDVHTGYRSSSLSVDYPADDARIDPLSAMLATMIDRPRSAGCDFDRRTYDGKRSMRVRMWEAGEQPGQLLCKGELTRLSGYDAVTMARGTQFSFQVEFAKQDDWLALTRADVDTEHGHVSLLRE